MTIKTLALTLFSVTAVASVSVMALDKVRQEDNSIWGTCPCINTDGAWNKVHGINPETRESTILLQSLDQTVSGLYSRSTNDMIEKNGGVVSSYGEIDIAIAPANTLQCSAYLYEGSIGETTVHVYEDTELAVTDCRKGLFKLTDSVSPQS